MEGIHRWASSLADLAEKLVRDGIRVHIAVYESQASNDTEIALAALDRRLGELGIDRTIVLDNESYTESYSGLLNDPENLLPTAYGLKPRRISHLANVRNKALEPLHTLTENGTIFDKVVFLNDVDFSAQDIVTLLHTRGGNYAAACGLDFLNPPPGHVVDRQTSGFNPVGVYDDFAMRDSRGWRIASHLYPYFHSGSSARSIVARRPARVQSCWNGAVAFDAAPFQDLVTPLQFRTIPRSLAEYHIEASESCLVHYDNPLTPQKGVFINPNVRVGYSQEAYKAVAQGAGGVWPTSFEEWGILKSHSIWWMKGWVHTVVVNSRIRKWQRKHPSAAEAGLACCSDLAMVKLETGRWRLLDGDFK
ncbi:MAG: hypothetical protein M1839_003248 [Geoglossum umbratile]|nr:MAG: hypothetical protein M1839_003248 [Geoglossum umbratile]